MTDQPARVIRARLTSDEVARAAQAQGWAEGWSGVTLPELLAFLYDLNIEVVHPVTQRPDTRRLKYAPHISPELRAELARQERVLDVVFPHRED